MPSVLALPRLLCIGKACQLPLSTESFVDVVEQTHSVYRIEQVHLHVMSMLYSKDGGQSDQATYQGQEW